MGEIVGFELAMQLLAVRIGAEFSTTWTVAHHEDALFYWGPDLYPTPKGQPKCLGKGSV